MSGYNFDDRHIARVLKLIMKDRDTLVNVLKENNGCGLKRISKAMPNTTTDARKAVQERVKAYELSKEDVINVGNIGLQKENGKAKLNTKKDRVKDSIGEE